jgi:hypothetical protein
MLILFCIGSAMLSISLAFLLFEAKLPLDLLFIIGLQFVLDTAFIAYLTK